ncbi:hypothetical protein AKJ09_10139 [Labilithrix luteola]|uniref:Lipoprotein n=1 Tax=Labilithrix luteola TaxID=1391654 RepID=A0A0K1QCG8_9BACT|nr:hypothetical protein [Labilithrix luteola]AKV03476.1 hypothetical protein AKJ09_10139 [Labilithrix luteola]
MIRSSLVALAALLIAACSAGESDPSTGTYTVQFPSTSAAIATDSVQLFVFDVGAGDPNARTTICQNLLQSRKRHDPMSAIVENPPVTTCELLQGAKPISVPYGEHAVLAIGARRGADFLMGCTVQTFGDGNAPIAIPLALADITVAVPATACNSVSDFCAKTCPSN